MLFAIFQLVFKMNNNSNILERQHEEHSNVLVSTEVFLTEIDVYMDALPLITFIDNDNFTHLHML